MESVIYMLIFFMVTIAVYAVSEGMYYRRSVVKERLHTIKIISLEVEEGEGELKDPFIKRIIMPTYQNLMKRFDKSTPSAIRNKYETLILTSGSVKKNFNNVVMMQFLMALLYIVLALVAFQYSGRSFNLIIILAAGLVGFSMPLLALYSKAEKRKESIRKVLPDLLDLLYVSVEAGLGLDMALKKATEKMRGPLSAEILHTLSEISKGRVREDALKGLAHRTGVKEVGTFVTAILQTEQLGSNIANMLRIQSATMRNTRRQRAEEQAAKVAVKMLFPLIFLMFPALFVVILGPAVINIFENFVSVRW